MRNPDCDRVSFPYPATIPDLFLIKGRAELIADRVVVYPLMGEASGCAKVEILVALDDHSRRCPGSEAYGGTVVYAVPRMASGRQSFSPDVSFHANPPWNETAMWVEGPPTFAVEIRVWEDYQSDTEPDRASKRADYFEAGTLVVWDVDPEAETVTKYAATDPLAPVVFRRGDVADAEPAVPGWRLAVDDVFA